MNRPVSRVIRDVVAVTALDLLLMTTSCMVLGTACMVPIAETHSFVPRVKLEVRLEILRGPWQPTASLPRLYCCLLNSWPTAWL